jgi:cytochrome c biogenesis factor
MTLGSVVVVIVALGLLGTVVLLVRSRPANPWSAIVVAMLTSAVCFTVGGGSDEDTAWPAVATVAASVVGILSVAAAIVALVPRPADAPPSRLPMMLASAGIVIGALALVVNQLTS